MPHLLVVAWSSRGSLRATGRLDTSIAGRLRSWASEGALGVLLIILRCEIFSPLESIPELHACCVSVTILSKMGQHYHARL